MIGPARTAFALAVASIVPTATAAQDQAPTENERLMGLVGQTVLVRYVPGYLDRAEHVLARADLVVADLEKLGKVPLSISAVVLPRDLWETTAMQRPWGLPAIVGGSIVAAPAMGDSESVRVWKNWLGTDLPALPGRPLRGTAEGASSLALADLIMQRDLAAIFTDRAGLGGNAPWIRGVMTQLAALTIHARYEAPRLLQIATMYRRFEEHLPALLPLANDRPMVAERWLLSQARYFRGAELIYGAHGEKALKSALKVVRKGGQLDRAKMIELFPEVAAWLAEESEPESES